VLLALVKLKYHEYINVQRLKEEQLDFLFFIPASVGKTFLPNWGLSYKYHRWARLLTQQTSMAVYRLPTKENKFPFSFSKQQTEVCRFLSPFAANK
jgi:hypothetical protein